MIMKSVNQFFYFIHQVVALKLIHLNLHLGNTVAYKRKLVPDSGELVAYAGVLVTNILFSCETLGHNNAGRGYLLMFATAARI
jgi:hypothetical protein